MPASLNRVTAWNLLRARWQDVASIGWTTVNHCGAWLAGVQLQQGCRFFGPTTFFKASGASVRFGQRCVFRSSPSSNLAGVNRACIFSAHQDAEMQIGSDCGFSGTVIGCFRSIIIGNRVRCGANTIISDGDWHPSDSRVGSPRPVKIGDGVWLGLNVIVMKGVNIGEGSLIGAGSVVTHDVPANVVAAGNPCRVIKSLP